LLLHAGALVLLATWHAAAPTEPPQPVPVTLLEEPEPAPEPPQSPRRLLRFRPERKLRVREPVHLLQESAALAPPPPDVPLHLEASGGGTAVEVSAPSVFTGFTLAGEGGGIAGEGFGAGNALGLEGASFAEYLGQLREVGLDVMFVIDSTGTMGWLIDEVKLRVRDLAAAIRRLVPVTRFGIVAYRDDEDPEFVTLLQPLTLSVTRVRRFLGELTARGGGDLPEAVDAGLRLAIGQAGWRPESKAVVVLVGDAPPHPERMETTLELVRGFRRQGGTVTTLDVSFDANPHIAAARLGVRVDQLTTLGRRGAMPEFRAIARAGGGEAATLDGEVRIVGRLAVLVFGEHYAEEARLLFGDL
jgi:hypothetical protein